MIQINDHKKTTQAAKIHHLRERRYLGPRHHTSSSPLVGKRKKKVIKGDQPGPGRRLIIVSPCFVLVMRVQIRARLMLASLQSDHMGNE
eukprot:14504-Pelagomonas_calceolata.AAC.6